jgi:hypothetical protein
MATRSRALYQQWSKPYTFNKLLKSLGAEIVKDIEYCDYDYTLANLDKDSFIKIFEKH